MSVNDLEKSVFWIKSNEINGIAGGCEFGEKFILMEVKKFSGTAKDAIPVRCIFEGRGLKAP